MYTAIKMSIENTLNPNKTLFLSFTKLENKPEIAKKYKGKMGM